jgi:uncharacterized protein YigA (DUF484 family)
MCSETHLEEQLTQLKIQNQTTEKTELPCETNPQDQIKQLQAPLEAAQKTLHTLETEFNASLVKNLTLRALVLNLWSEIEQNYGFEKLKEWNEDLLSGPEVSEDDLEVISALEEEESDTRRKKARGVFYGKRNLGVDMVECVGYLMKRRDVKGIAQVMDLWCGRGRGIT